MIQHNCIVTYGLTDKENSCVAQNLPTKKYKLWIGDVYTDLIAWGSAAIIVFGPALTEEETVVIADYYTEIGGPADETIKYGGNVERYSLRYSIPSIIIREYLLVSCDM